MVWDARAWNNTVNFSPLMQAIEDYRTGSVQKARFDADRRIGADIASGNLGAAMTSAADAGKDPSILLSIGEKARQDQERQRMAEALKNPNLTRGMSPAYMAALEALPPEQRAAQLAQAQSPMTQAQMAGQAISRQLSQAQLAQIKNQTPEARAGMAQSLGLQPGTNEYRTFVVTGQLSQPQQPKYMEVNGKVVAIPANGGPASVAYDGGPNFDKLPEFSAKAAGFTSRMVEAEDNTRRITADPKKFDPTSVSTGLVRSMLPEAIGNVVARSPEMQQYEQSAEQWIRAFLRKESGAAIGRDEFQRDFKVYFPQPGDGPEVVKQKERARLDAMRSFQGETRGFFDHTSPQQAARLKGWQQPQPNPALDEARDAIQRGAPRDKVIERLRQNGIDPTGL